MTKPANIQFSDDELKQIVTDCIEGKCQSLREQYRAGMAIASLMNQIDAQSMYFSARMRKANEDLAAVRDVTNDTVDECQCRGFVHQNDCKHWVLPL